MLDNCKLKQMDAELQIEKLSQYSWIADDLVECKR